MRSRAEVVEQPALFGCLRSEADEVSLERGNDEPVLEEYHPSWRSERGLDWFAFFLADIQTGWGPFVAAYLTSKAWTQLDIGLILTVGTLSAMVLQVPVGALVDLIPGKRLLAAIAVAAISGSALLLAFWPVFSVVLVAKVLHAIASCLAGPVLAAISLGLVGHTLLSTRLGRNSRFLSLGNAIAAGLMGGVAHYFSNQAIFLLTAALGVPTLIALAQIRSADIDPDLARGGAPDPGLAGSYALASTLRNWPLLVFAAAVVLFQLSNAAMLPLMAGSLTARAPEWATALIAICILAPQFVVAAIAPAVGRTAQSWGRRPLLMLCFHAIVRPRCGIRLVERPCCGRCGSAARRHFGGDAWCAGAARDCRHDARQRPFQFRSRRGRRRRWHRCITGNHACGVCRGQVRRRRRVLISGQRWRRRSSSCARTHARDARRPRGVRRRKREQLGS